MTDQEYMIQLLQQETLSDEEAAWLAASDAARRDALWSTAAEQFVLRMQAAQNATPSASAQQALEAILQQLQGTGETTERIRPAHRIHFLRTAWFRYAAAVLIALGIGTFVYINNQKEKPSVTQHHPVPVQNDVAPGGNRATLTLADGSKIILDSARRGTIARQGEVRVRKTGDGSVVYEGLRAGKGTEAVLMNTMTTPRGGQYQLTLPDGSQVWLNAESSITYPTAFTGNERQVSITGEAYFEVTHNAKQPFRVATADQTIEVLGTKFNVNAYKEEPTINTTLLEGAVRLSSTSVHTSLTLKPGQQGQLSPDRQLSLADHPDIDQVMAWKNGVFNFNNKSFAEVMRMLSRWYDVEVVYEGKVPPMRIGGKMGRDLNLGDVLQALKAIGVKYRIEGKTLKVIA